MDAAITSRINIDLSEINLWRAEGWQELASGLNHNFMYYVSQMISERGGSYTLIVLAIFLIVMTTLKVGATYMALFSMIPLRTGVVRDIRNQINDKITALNLGFFSEERKGDILSRISGDVVEIENSVVSSLDSIIKNPILILIYLLAMLAISWQLTIFVFVLLPVAGFVMGLVGKNLKRKGFEGQTQWGKLMSQVEETLGGLRIIKAFNAEEKIRQRFRQANETFRKISVRILARQQLAHPVSELLGTITIAIVLWYGGSLILSGQGQIDAPTFIYYLIIFYSLINPAKELSRSAYAIQKGLASLDRVDMILFAENEIKDPETPLPLPFEENICYENVSFRYHTDGPDVLKRVTLKIPKGKTVALVGSSGGGKSTLVDLLPRFYDVTQGRITIDGNDIRTSRIHELRSLMGNVNQEAILFNDSIRANISFGRPDASEEEIRQAAGIANALEFIDAMPEGLDTNIGDRGSKLSGGQRQRLSIARAILKNPPILILDEATSALDSEGERLVQNALEHLMEGRTTIVIAHRLSTIIRADLICVIEDGEIVERGKHEELLALGGKYSSLYKLQYHSEA